MWEYATWEASGREFRKLGDTLGEWGEQGWEAVGMVPTGWMIEENGSTTSYAAPTIGVLLKRRIAEK